MLAPGAALPQTGAWHFCWNTMLSVNRGVSSTFALKEREASAIAAKRKNLFISALFWYNFQS
jgi:hypothetical protein